MKLKVFLLFVLFFSTSMAQKLNDNSLEKETNLAMRNAIHWLDENQQDDGSWGHYPAITALVVASYLKSNLGFDDVNSIPVIKGIQFLLKCQQPDGGIYVDELKAYNTAISLIALSAADNPEYADAIRRARDFLLTLQLDENLGFTSSDEQYGGIGYDENKESDLSNLEWSLEALKESEKYRKVSESTGQPLEYSGTNVKSTQIASSSSRELFWDKAILFLQRCQNLQTTNDRNWAGSDGGFIYSPSESKAGDYTSYGSMTYAGLKSFIYADVNKDDKRVQAAFNWVKNNYTVENNPQMGEQGLFYYFHTMAKALNVYGDETITDNAGTEHNWRKDIIEKLLKIQNGEGYWVNSNNRWWENNKELVTAYSILTLSYALGY
ncbi:MAG: terpene cyclase/mutase family protein [Ignavibacteriaceae bacterium]|nr:terpene cyclase/mutase family protein [Ignavibacteriaceae bacterium]